MPAPQFTTPKTWVASEPVHADGSSGLNTQLRDNMLAVSEHILAQYTASSTSDGTISFTQLPPAGPYEHLRLSLNGRGTNAAATIQLFMQLSSDSSTAPAWSTGANYSGQYQQSVGSVLTAASTQGSTAVLVGVLPAAGAPAGMPGWIEADLPAYARTTFFKGVSVAAGLVFGTATNEISQLSLQGVWRSTAPIRAIRLFPLGNNFDLGTIATLSGRRTTSTST